MYLIINSTLKQTFQHEGNYPCMSIDEMLNRGDDLIVISTYSNTIKVPIKPEILNGIVEWEWKEYTFPGTFII